jgi:DHA3 family macrolide efflux protein-like MFS transporter
MQDSTQQTQQPVQDERDNGKGIKGHKSFMTVWFGQTLSTFGAQVTAFALSIWTFHETGSVVLFGLVIAAQLAPAVILSPFAGALIDTYSRRKVMMICDFCMLLVCLPLIYWASEGMLSVQKVIMVTPLLTTFSMVHSIAYSSSIASLVPKRLYGTANGLVQFGANASAIVVPMVAVIILESVGVYMILMINIISYVFAIATLAVASFPYAVVKDKDAKSKFDFVKVFKQQKFGFNYLRNDGQKALITLLVVLSSVSLLNGLVQVLFRPMILMTESQMVIGEIVTVAGIGGFIGAIFSGLFVNRFNKVKVMLFFSYLAAVMAMLCGMTGNKYLLGLIAFVFSFAMPIIMVASQTLWQLLVPSELQGRVFATRLFFGSVVLMSTILIAPLITEYALEPLMLEGNMGSDLFGSIVGVGPGRGIGLMFLLSGIVLIFTTFIVSLNSNLRKLSTDIDEQKTEAVPQN